MDANISRLPRHLRHWRRITGAGALASAAQRRDAILILSARKIPWRLHKENHSEYLYVPAMYEHLAFQELAQYAAENSPQPPPAPLLLHSRWQLAPLYLLPLLVFFARIPPAWDPLGVLNGAAVLLRHEWWRVGTALTLHVSWDHVAGNVFFGSIFLCALARLVGLGRACLLTFSGGMLGNALNVLLHNLAFRSVGFSTAVFATLGALAGAYICRRHEKVYLPLAAALALLAMLGTEGIRTDYVGHLCGLASGFLLGILDGVAQRRHWRQLPQSIALLLAILLPIGLWLLALRPLTAT